MTFQLLPLRITEAKIAGRTQEDPWMVHMLRGGLPTLPAVTFLHLAPHSTALS